jgi:hypothetical protein
MTAPDTPPVDSPRHSPAPKHASVADAHALRTDQIRDTEETIQHQLAGGERMPVRAPSPLKVSGRVLVVTFLLPFEATIDLEDGRVWVTPKK